MVISRLPIAWLLAIVVIVLDQLSKVLVVVWLPVGYQIQLIPGFFRLVHIRNPGAAFGIFADLDPRIRLPFLLFTSLVAIGVIVYLYLRQPDGGAWWRAGLALILAGAVSNTGERLFRGEVVDYFDFYVGKWHWPAFNVADSAVTIGMMILAYQVLFRQAMQEKQVEADG